MSSIPTRKAILPIRDSRVVLAKDGFIEGHIAMRRSMAAADHRVHARNSGR
jgi:hypothetical protein